MSDAILSEVCHRIPERSFLWLWDPPLLCARCTGFYAALFFGGAIAALARVRKYFRAHVVVASVVLLIAELAIERVFHIDPGNAVRALTAMPFGLCLGVGLLLPIVSFISSNKKGSC